MSRKHLMSVACHDGDHLAQGFSTTHSYDDRRETEMRVLLCKPVSGRTTGWAQVYIEHHYEKQSRSLGICLNRKQAEALRDLLNAAFGGSSRVARTIRGSVYGECHVQAEVRDA